MEDEGMVGKGPVDKGKGRGAKEIARILRGLDHSGQTLGALASLVKGSAKAHLAVTDGKGKLDVVAIPGLEDAAEGYSVKRQAQLEALRRGIRLDDGGLWIEECPFSEIFVEHDPFNENPPFLEGPLDTGGDDGFWDVTPWNENPPWAELAPFDEIFVERAAFREATPGGTFTGDHNLIDLTPWNENPPFVEGPWNEHPPFVEHVQNARGLTKSLRWEVRSDQPLEPGDHERMGAVLRDSSLVRTFAEIKKKIDRP